MGAWLTLFFTPSSKIITINRRKFIIQKKIGEGGFSYVYSVEDPYASKQFAIKKTLCQTEELFAAAKKEIDILKNYKQENLLKLFDFEFKRNASGQEVFTLLPFHKRGTVQDILYAKREKSQYFSEQEVLKMFLQTCKAVSEFHKQKPPLAHNDIKPGNLLISDSGNIILFDFGSVSPGRHLVNSRQEASSLQYWAQSNCTPLFKPPELFDVISDMHLDERTDIWALGCTLYAMAFNQSPFESHAEQGSVALAVSVGKYDIPAGSEKRLSKGVIELIDSMLQTDLTKRPFIGEVIERVTKLLGEDSNDVVLSIH